VRIIGGSILASYTEAAFCPSETDPRSPAHYHHDVLVKDEAGGSPARKWGKGDEQAGSDLAAMGHGLRADGALHLRANRQRLDHLAGGADQAGYRRDRDTDGLLLGLSFAAPFGRVGLVPAAEAA
jgi:hypothetical protein